MKWFAGVPLPVLVGWFLVLFLALLALIDRFVFGNKPKKKSDDGPTERK